jgi:hypothetical protein
MNKLLLLAILFIEIGFAMSINDKFPILDFIQLNFLVWGMVILAIQATKYIEKYEEQRRNRR